MSADLAIGLNGHRANMCRLACIKPASLPPEQVFVDEITCIGCTNCAAVCPKTFHMQWDEHGRARAVRQGVDGDGDLQEAIDTCPVNCIHWYTRLPCSLQPNATRSILPKGIGSLP